MAAIGFIYAWQKLYPVLIFRSVLLTETSGSMFCGNILFPSVSVNKC